METADRLNKQELDRIQKQIDLEEEKISTEGIVFDRMIAFLEDKNLHKKSE